MPIFECCGGDRWQHLSPLMPFQAEFELGSNSPYPWLGFSGVQNPNLYPNPSHICDLTLRRDASTTPLPPYDMTRQRHHCHLHTQRADTITSYCKGPKGQANSLSMYNPRTDGNDQGGDPLSPPCLYILHR